MSLTLLEKQLAAAAEFELLTAAEKSALARLATAARNELYDVHDPPERLVRSCPVALLVADVHELEPGAVVQATFDDDSCALTISRSATNLVRVAGFSRTGQIVKQATVTSRAGKKLLTVRDAKFDSCAMAEAIVDALGA